MLYTAQLLVAALTNHEEVNEIGKVSVILPYYFTNNIVTDVAPAIEIEEPIEEIKEEVSEIKEEEISEVTIEEINEEELEVVATRIPPLPTLPTLLEKEFFSLVEEEEDELAPTLTLHEKKEPIEVNDLVLNDTQSINEILNEHKKEIVSNWVDTPVKDLRKAIGINDKYLFIKELFNSDEAMYERSIKTINNFSVYPEAEQWIKRELFTKLCWLANNETVQVFDNMVRRRFA
jgi:hypothetical protein